MGILDYFRKGNTVGGVRAADKGKSPIGIWLTDDTGEDIKCSGYTSLADNPDVFTACRKIAMLISSMPVMLMQNGESGDERIFNELSRKIDIDPNPDMTRHTLFEAIVMTLLLYGRGNSVAVPKTSRGFLQSITPMPASRVSVLPNTTGKGYKITIDGKEYNPNDLLHFVDNPDPYYPWRGKGLTIQLKEAANNLKQASSTRKGFMSSKWKPSVIVKVDGMIDEFASPEGRQKLLENYVQSASAGEPWLIPADQFSVEQIRPLSLADLAISDSVILDKKTIASVVGVPPFLLGAGEYKQVEWNAFISNTVRPIAQEIEQELTRKLIINPKWYLKFNILSLMDWDIKTISEVFCSLSDRGFVSGNEVRDRIGMSPKEGLDEMRVLENYIGWEYSNKQKKLITGEEE